MAILNRLIIVSKPSDKPRNLEVVTNEDRRDLRDLGEHWPVAKTNIEARGYCQNYLEEDIEKPDGSVMTRQYVSHTGSVAIIALNDQNQIAVVHQYRHPVRMRLVEPPAGLLDIAEESALDAAKRELAEEAQLEADSWQILVDSLNSPGGSAEGIRIYLAQGLKPAPHPQGFVVSDEEADMGLYWLGIDQILERIFAGEIQNPALTIGVLALVEARRSSRKLRDANSPWPYRDNLTKWLASL